MPAFKIFWQCADSINDCICMGLTLNSILSASVSIPGGPADMPSYPQYYNTCDRSGKKIKKQKETANAISVCNLFA